MQCKVENKRRWAAFVSVMSGRKAARDKEESRASNMHMYDVVTN